MVLRTTDLFNSKKECCGCSACMNACPKGAITMKEDEYGFIYPDIDEQKCIDCGSCKRACSLQTEASLKTPTEGYAVYNTDTEMLMQSSSGGAFSALAPLRPKGAPARAGSSCAGVQNMFKAIWVTFFGRSKRCFRQTERCCFPVHRVRWRDCISFLKRIMIISTQLMLFVMECLMDVCLMIICKQIASMPTNLASGIKKRVGKITIFIIFQNKNQNIFIGEYLHFITILLI